METTHFPIEASWSEEDAGFLAIVPDLPGCSAWGESEADAIREAYDAIAAWLEAAQAAGRVIPEPTPPQDGAGYSGRSGEISTIKADIYVRYCEA